jgi:hypothetical protein
MQHLLSRFPVVIQVPVGIDTECHFHVPLKAVEYLCRDSVTLFQHLETYFQSECISHFKNVSRENTPDMEGS